MAAAAIAAVVTITISHQSASTGDDRPSPNASVPLNSLQSASPPQETSAGFDITAAEHLITAKGYLPLTPKRTPPGPLRAIVGICSGSINGRCVETFFFYDNHFAGVSDRSGDTWYLDIVRQDGKTVTLGYPTQRDGDPACCPTGPSTIRHFTWNGSHVVASTASPPSANFAPGAVPTAIAR